MRKVVEYNYIKMYFKKFIFSDVGFILYDMYFSKVIFVLSSLSFTIILNLNELLVVNFL